MKRLITVCAVAFLLAGCPSFTTMHTATPVKGTQVSGSAGVLGATGTLGTGDTNILSGGGAIPYGLELSGRHGFSDTVGAGAKLTTLGGIGADVNIAPINTSAFAFSINPTATIIPAGIIYGNVEANLLADVVKAQKATVTIGAKPGGYYGSFIGEGGFTPYIGGTVGGKFWINQRVALMPWADMIYLPEVAQEAQEAGGEASLFLYTVMLGINARVGSLPGDAQTGGGNGG